MKNKENDLREGFNAHEDINELDARVREGTKRLLEHFREERRADPTDNAQTTQILIDCLKDATVVDPQVFFYSGIDPLHRDSDTGMTLLHFAAGYDDRDLLRLLLAPDTDYTMKDRHGRFASTLAYECSRDFVMGRLLIKKQGEQARERGVILYGPRAGMISLQL